ncbi:glycosyltransferase [Geomicrobium sp. JSM 1781026]|uniref:glycosyltransferase n=1 Tax=Geomicrobium sp. JSM 1781026 TaxID=3344580 RepID=UPI0035C19029
MILVVLGTQELPFKRLLINVNQMALDGDITEDIIVQSGHTTTHEFECIESRPFFSYDEMDNLYNRARFIISHGGTGSIITGVKKQKPVIAVPRLSKYGEHNDDHQLEIVKQFSSTGHILGSGNLKLDIDKVNEGFSPAPFVSGRDHIVNMIRNFVHNQA